MKHLFKLTALFVVLNLLSGCDDKEGGNKIENDYTVAAFYWPAYHYEPRSEFLFPEKTGEWEIIRNSLPKEEGHQQPKVPLWGYQDEANPEEMDLKIKTALEYGVNTFIFDWYWFEKKPFLESCINDGFLKANKERMNFYLMWANHDATTYWDVKNPRVDSVYWEGGVDREQFNIVVNRVISQYFKEPSYLKIEGEPVFCIYELNTLINGLGDPEKPKRLSIISEKNHRSWISWTSSTGNIMGSTPSTIEGVPGDPIKSQDDVLTYFGFKSLTNYCWAHLHNPDGDYEMWGDASTNMWNQFKDDFSMTYFPNLTVSWDANPRFPFKAGYINNSTPEKFKKYLIKAKKFIDDNNIEPKIVTINAWNEWSEGSYLEPDKTWGYGYLEAVKKRIWKNKLKHEGGDNLL